MNEAEFRNALENYLLLRRESDIQFTELKIEGLSFSQYHINRLKRENKGNWDEAKAKARIDELMSLGVRVRKKCEHCSNVYDMHTGSNFCEQCQKFTFVPAFETSN